MILAGICAEFFGVRGYQLDWRLFLKVLVVSTFVSGAVTSLFLYPIRDAGHVAAWAQAIGSVLAIVAAIFVSSSERRHTINQQKGNAQLKIMLNERQLRDFAVALAVSCSAINVLQVIDSANEGEGLIREYADKAVAGIERMAHLARNIDWSLFIERDAASLESTRLVILTLAWLEDRFSGRRGDPALDFNHIANEKIEMLSEEYRKLTFWSFSEF